MRQTVNVKYTGDFKDLVFKKEKRKWSELRQTVNVELRQTVNVKYTGDFKDLVFKKENYPINNFYIDYILKQHFGYNELNKIPLNLISPLKLYIF